MTYPLYLRDGGVEDWNNVLLPGWYSGNSNALNRPSTYTGAWINAIVTACNSNNKYLFLIAFDEDGHLFFRKSDDSGWGSWKKII